MRITKNLLLCLATAGVAFLGNHVAKADSLTLPMGDTLTGRLNGSFLGTASAPGMFNITVNNNTKDSNIYYAGEIYWDKASDTAGQLGGAGQPSTFLTFCTELYTNVYIGTTDCYTVVPLSTVSDVQTSAQATLIEDVLAYAQSSLVLPPNYDKAGLKAVNAAAAGVQVAIWKIIYDYTGYSLQSPTVTDTINWTGTAAWQSDATSYLNSAVADYAGGNKALAPASVLGLKSTTGVQNQSILAFSPATPRQSVTPTPKSFVAGVVLFGLLGLVGLLRRPAGIPPKVLL